MGRTACINGKTQRERERKKQNFFGVVLYRVLSSVDGLLPPF